MLFDIIQNNYACVVISVVFLVFIITDKSFEFKIEMFFIVAIAIVMCLTIVDNLELFEAQKSYPTLARKIYSAIGYALRPATAIMMTLIMNYNKVISQKVKSVYGVYIAVFWMNAMFSLLSIYNGWVFAYTKENVFIRGRLGMLPFVTAGVCIAGMIAFTLVGVGKHCYLRTLVIFVISLLCIGGMVMEVIFNFDGTLNTACGIGILFYYLYLHVTIYSTDELTKAYNRRIFYMDINKLHKTDAIIVGIDLNNLKHINDTYGHAEGDQALITFTEIIQRNLNNHCTLYIGNCETSSQS